ncbi:efflux RND transporter periplasmic adaptor subunit [Marinihelvus fidelis]|nr:efflux RND transporter periplasmic adaptor subunit [Marinihelvus fidelis]
MGNLLMYPSSPAGRKLAAFACLLSMSSAFAESPVAALGRLEPQGGIVRIAAPSTPLSLAGSVLSSLEVAEGDMVEKGQLLAVTDAEPALQTAVNTARAELDLQVRAAEAAESRADEACIKADVVGREAGRREQLLGKQLASQEEVEQSRGQATALAATCQAVRADARVAAAAIETARARLAQREAEWRRAYVYAPFAGRVLHISAEPGEYVGTEGILELGRVGQMLAIAEVHETDIGRVAVDMPARVESAALPGPLTGRVTFIRPKVMKQDEIGTDPAARKDARIIEVGIALDDSTAAAALTNLQVEVLINGE